MQQSKSQYINTALSEIEQLFRNKKPYTQQILTFIISFTNTYKLEGHPIVEYHILTRLYEPIIYNSISTFNIDDQLKIRAFAKEFCEKLIGTFNNPALLVNPISLSRYAEDVQYNNFQSIRIHCVTSLGKFLNIKSFIEWGRLSLMTQLERNIYASGESYDLVHRDSVGYHVYNMKPLLKTIQILNCLPDYAKIDFYNMQTEEGASIKKSIRYIIPYVTKQKINYMLLGSKLASDTKSSNYGKIWPIDDAKQLFKDASLYDDEIKYIYNITWVKDDQIQS